LAPKLLVGFSNKLIIPSYATALKFEYNECPNISNFPSLTHLTLNCIHARKLPDLPPSITHLTFGDNFNYRIAITNLPLHLVYLSFGGKFNQQITLPPSIETLIFGTAYNQPITHLPRNLIHLTFKAFRDTFPLLDNIPLSLQKLIVGEHVFQKRNPNEPLSLTHLTFIPYRNLITPTNQFIDSTNEISALSVPHTLTHLTCTYSWPIDTNNLPPNLLSLTVGDYFDEHIDGLSPHSLLLY
jgi:hypothetical protein